MRYAALILVAIALSGCAGLFKVVDHLVEVAEGPQAEAVKREPVDIKPEAEKEVLPGLEEPSGEGPAD